MSQATLRESVNWLVRRGELEPPDRDRPDCREDLARLLFKNRRTGAEAPFRCGMWECECCGHHMKMNFLREVDRLVEERPQLSRLLTLTVDSKRWDREEAHREIGEAWNRLKANLRAQGLAFSYVWVREETERGMPHLHVLVSRYLPQKMVSRAWEDTGMGSVVDIRKVNARKAGNYLAKYLSKGAMARLPSGVHRYGSSEDIDLAVRGGSDDGPTDWELVVDDPVVGGLRGVAPGDFVRRDRPLDRGKDPPKGEAQPSD